MKLGFVTEQILYNEDDPFKMILYDLVNDEDWRVRLVSLWALEKIRPASQELVELENQALNREVDRLGENLPI